MLVVFGFVLMVAVVFVVVLVVVVLVVVVAVDTWANVAAKVWVAAVVIERAVGGQVGR